MIQILPVYVPGYLVPFMINELDGVSVVEENEIYTNIAIESNSVLGMFLRRRIKPDYKIKNYQMIIYCKKISEQTAFTIDLMEFQNKAQFKVDLSFAELEEVYKFLKYTFTLSFYFFVKGFLKRNRITETEKQAGVRAGIRHFIEDYDLLEYGYSENQMRRLFYNYKNTGVLIQFQKNGQLNRTNKPFLL